MDMRKQHWWIKIAYPTVQILEGWKVDFLTWFPGFLLCWEVLFKTVLISSIHYLSQKGNHFVFSKRVRQNHLWWKCWFKAISLQISASSSSTLGFCLQMSADSLSDVHKPLQSSYKSAQIRKYCLVGEKLVWCEVSEDDKAVGSPGTDGILQCEKPSFGDWTHMY